MAAALSSEILYIFEEKRSEEAVVERTEVVVEVGLKVRMMQWTSINI